MPQTRKGFPRQGLLALLVIGLASIGALILGRRVLRRWRSGPPRTPPEHPTEQDLVRPSLTERRRWEHPTAAVIPSPPTSAVAPTSQPRQPLLAFLAIALAAVPPGLVVADRWLGLPEMQALGREAWCRVEALCQSALPGYFLYALPALLCSLLLLLLYRRLPSSSDILPHPLGSERVIPHDARSRSRTGRLLRLVAGIGLVPIAIAGFTQGRVPGWDYIAVSMLYVLGVLADEMPFAAWLSRLRQKAPRWASIVLSQVGLSLFLAGVSGGPAWMPVVGLVLLFPLLYLLIRGVRLPITFWLISALVVVYTYRVNSWMYSVIGDEYAFFEYARDIARDHGLREIGERVFSGRAVYGDHPYLSSLIQAASMMLLGVDNLGWRFSNGYLVALAAGLFYLFWRGFLSRRAALAAAVLLGASHYLINFSKIGYNNVQALFAAALALCAAGAAVRSRSRVAYTATGLAMGLCLYVYPGALYALPLPLLLLLLFAPPNSREGARRWAMMTAAFGLLLLPLLFQPGYWQSKVKGTIINNPDLLGPAETLTNHLWTNALYSFTSYVYAPEETHYVASSFVDPLSAIFIPIGAAIIAWRARRDRFVTFICLAAITELILAGVTHDRRLPPTTRMFMMLPWWTVLTALGLAWCLDQFKPVQGGRWPLAVSLALIVGLNLYQAYGLFRHRWEGRASLEVLFLRVVQRDAQADPGHEKLYLFLTQPDWGIDGLRLLRDVYGVPASQDNLARVALEAPLLEAEVASTIQRGNTVVIIQPWMDANLRQGLEELLRRMGKVECQVRDGLLTRAVFSLWLSPAHEDLCRLANLP